MIQTKHLLLSAITLCIAGLILIGNNRITVDNRTNNLEKQQNFQVVFESISSILRTQLSSVFTMNDTLYVGDNVGSVAIWSFDQKKNKLAYQDISREITPQLPSTNNVIALDGTSEAILSLTNDGKVTAYLTNSALKITGKVQLQISESLKQIRVINIPGEKLLISGVNTQGNQLCVYQIKESLARPNPLQKISCNSTIGGLIYSGLDYDANQSLITVGDSTRSIFFSLNLTDTEKLKYLCEAFLPKAEVAGYKSRFSRNGTLVAINDLWVCSIIIDLSVPSAKVLSSDRTQKIVKTGETTSISVNREIGGKSTKVIINSKTTLQGFNLGTNQKLTYQNASRVLGKAQNFELKSSTVMFATVGNQVTAVTIGSGDKDYFTVLDSYPIQSSNHFKSVMGFGYQNNTIITTSEGGENNFKIWHLNNNKLTLVDQKTFTFFTLLKSGPMNLLSVAMMPPPAKSTTGNQAANATLHVAAAGSDLFNIIVVKLTSDDKIGSFSKSKGEHSGNITALFVTADQKQMVSGSMDSSIKVWQISTNRDLIEDNETTIATKNGPIRAGVQDKTGNYYVFAHCNTLSNKLVNITLWTLDAKSGVVKVAQNVAGQAHQSNLTALILSTDEKYLISLSESGQLRLWRHVQWTMIDLLASLSLGFADATISMTKSNKVVIETKTEFIEYAFDFNGFILIGRSQKKYVTQPKATIISSHNLFSGGEDGSIRVYSISD